jgi:hypothetical protein
VPAAEPGASSEIAAPVGVNVGIGVTALLLGAFAVELRRSPPVGHGVPTDGRRGAAHTRLVQCRGAYMMMATPMR